MRNVYAYLQYHSPTCIRAGENGSEMIRTYVGENGNEMAASHEIDGKNKFGYYLALKKNMLTKDGIIAPSSDTFSTTRSEGD